MDPAIYKEIVVAHAGRNFVNGDTEFDITPEQMDQMVMNFTMHPRQVPILMGGDHELGPERADRPASGWTDCGWGRNVGRAVEPCEAQAPIRTGAPAGGRRSAASGHRHRHLRGRGPLVWTLAETFYHRRLM